MPLSPPASPTVGQTYTANGRTWSWTGTAWELVAASGGGSATLTAATASELGGIKVGSGLAIADGVLSATGDTVLRALFVPGTPTSVTATGGNTQATVSWTAPTGVISQAPITDYIVQGSSNSGSTWTTVSRTASTTASQVVTGLTNGTAYVFRVAAINGVGTGAYTSASSSVTPVSGTPPNAPTSLSATAGNAQIALSWTAPSAPGTSAISGYTVEYTPSGGSAQTVSTGSTSTSYTLTGLTNGTAYTVRVAGVSAAGAGTYTSASSSVTPSAGTPPNAPTSLTATAGNSQISLSWTAPSAPGTSAISGYTVEYTPSGGSAQTVSTGSTGTTYTLTGLTNGTAYTVRVAAVSAVGTGTFTASSSSVSPSAASFSAIAAGWSGTGTAADKLVAPQSPRDFAGGTFNNAQFTVGVAGTFRVTGTHHDGNDGCGNQVSKNGTVIYDAGYGTADFSVSVAANDVIRVFSPGSCGAWFPNTRVWLVPS